MPAIIVDRIGDVLVVQLNGAGPDSLTERTIVAAPWSRFCRPRGHCSEERQPRSRTIEGLQPSRPRLARTACWTDRSTLIENGARFLIDPLEGQKTGWFYDQRDNRAFVAKLAKGGSVLDVYCYGGGFGIACAVAGAASVMLIDRSAPALDAAMASAKLNGVDDRCTPKQQEAFAALSALAEAGEQFDTVIVDPPAFAKSRKDVPNALRAYRKLTRLAATLVAPGSILFAASCSRNITVESFGEEKWLPRSARDAGRTGPHPPPSRRRSRLHPDAPGTARKRLSGNR